MIDFRTVSRNGLGCMIVREDEYDVGLRRPQVYGLQDQSQCQQPLKASFFVFSIFHFNFSDVFISRYFSVGQSFDSA
jgi:hypothetical protein